MPPRGGGLAPTHLASQGSVALSFRKRALVLVAWRPLTRAAVATLVRWRSVFLSSLRSLERFRTNRLSHSSQFNTLIELGWNKRFAIFGSIGPKFR